MKLIIDRWDRIIDIIYNVGNIVTKLINHNNNKTTINDSNNGTFNL